VKIASLFFMLITPLKLDIYSEYDKNIVKLMS